MRAALVILLLTIAAPVLQPLMAQGSGPATRVTGRVVSAETAAPLSAVSVSVHNPSDSSVVTGTLTNQQGAFSLPLPPGEYFVRVTNLGFATRTVDGVRVGAEPGVVNLGTIEMEPQAVELEGVVVRGEQAAVQIQVDRTTYNVEKMPAAAGGNATDILRNVPAVQVDMEGNLSLRGNQNVAVHVNGRPMPLNGEQLANFLRQIPASMVEEVEVIPNPSAKHDPSGMGGIINIVLKQNAELGWSGGVTLGASSQGHLNGSGNLGYQGGPLSLTGSYGYNQMVREMGGSTFRTNLYETDQRYRTDLTASEFVFRGHMLNLRTDYELSDVNSLNANLLYSLRDSDRSNVTRYTFMTADSVVIDEHGFVNGSEGEQGTVDASFGFARVHEPQQDEITAEVRYRIGDQTEDRWRELEEDPASPHVLVETDALDEGNRRLTAQLDLTRPLWQGSRLESGYKGTFDRLDNDLTETTFDPALPSEPAEVLRNDFSYDERVHAAYGLLTQELGAVDLQAGLRVEHTATRFDLLASGETHDNDYLSLFPSASILYELSPQAARTLRLSYARRIQRPDTRLLNPFPLMEDEYSVFVGNPELQPEYTDAYELTYQQRGSWGTLQVTPFYRHTTDIVRQYRRVMEDAADTTTFLNLDKSDSYGADVTTSLRLGSFSGFVSASAFRRTTSGEDLDLSSETLTWNARLSLSYRATPSTEIQYFQYYRAPQEIEQGRISGFTFTNLAVRQQLFDDRLSLTARASDPFGWMAYEFRTEDQLHRQLTTREMDMRAIVLSASWTFGEKPRMTPRTGQQPQGGVDEDIGIY